MLTRVKITKIGHNSRDDGRTIFLVRYSESACKNEPSCKFSSLLAKDDFFVKIFVRTSTKNLEITNILFKSTLLVGTRVLFSISEKKPVEKMTFFLQKFVFEIFLEFF